MYVGFQRKVCLFLCYHLVGGKCPGISRRWRSGRKVHAQCRKGRKGHDSCQCPERHSERVRGSEVSSIVVNGAINDGTITKQMLSVHHFFSPWHASFAPFLLPTSTLTQPFFFSHHSLPRPLPVHINSTFLLIAVHQCLHVQQVYIHLYMA